MRLTGTGLGWRRPIGDLVARYAASGRLGFAELVAENHRPTALDPRIVALRDGGLPIVVHGVTLGLGGSDHPQPARLEALAALAAATRAPLVSEHVAFVRASDSPDEMHGDVLEAGHLLPPPRTRDALGVLVENVRIAQRTLPVPLALENIAAYFSWPEDELDEPDFFAELVERTGVRLVVDVANLFASALRRGTDPAAELARFPLHAVAYAHVAGGEFQRVGEGPGEAVAYLDTHAHDMVPPVLDLLAQFVELYDAEERPGIMLERDADVSPETVDPEFRALEAAVRAAVAR